jgi:hypothetical protein
VDLIPKLIFFGVILTAATLQHASFWVEIVAMESEIHFVRQFHLVQFCSQHRDTAEEARRKVCIDVTLEEIRWKSVNTHGL